MRIRRCPAWLVVAALTVLWSCESRETIRTRVREIEDLRVELRARDRAMRAAQEASRELLAELDRAACDARELELRRKALEVELQGARDDRGHLVDERDRLLADIDSRHREIEELSSALHVARISAESYAADFAEVEREHLALRRTFLDAQDGYEFSDGGAEPSSAGLSTKHRDQLHRLREVERRLLATARWERGSGPRRYSPDDALGARNVDPYVLYREDPEGWWRETAGLLTARLAGLFSGELVWDSIDLVLFAVLIVAFGAILYTFGTPLRWLARRRERRELNLLRRRNRELREGPNEAEGPLPSVVMPRRRFRTTLASGVTIGEEEAEDSEAGVSVQELGIGPESVGEKAPPAHATAATDRPASDDVDAGSTAPIRETATTTSVSGPKTTTPARETKPTPAVASERSRVLDKLSDGKATSIISQEESSEIRSSADLGGLLGDSSVDSGAALASETGEEAQPVESPDDIDVHEDVLDLDRLPSDAEGDAVELDERPDRPAVRVVREFVRGPVAGDSGHLEPADHDEPTADARQVPASDPPEIQVRVLSIDSDSDLAETTLDGSDGAPDFVDGGSGDAGGTESSAPAEHDVRSTVEDRSLADAEDSTSHDQHTLPSEVVDPVPSTDTSLDAHTILLESSGLGDAPGLPIEAEGESADGVPSFEPALEESAEAIENRSSRSTPVDPLSAEARLDREPTGNTELLLELRELVGTRFGGTL